MSSNATGRPSFQFRLRGIFIVTTIAAALAQVARWMKVSSELFFALLPFVIAGAVGTLAILFHALLEWRWRHAEEFDDERRQEKDGYA
jgi:hypothetical protein